MVPLPRRSQTLRSLSRKMCGSKPEYCCDSQKFKEPFRDITRSLIFKINAWRAEQKNTCKQNCVLNMHKFGMKPPSYNSVDRRLTKYAAKFKAIHSQLPDDSILKEDMENLWKVIEKRRSDSYACQKGRRDGHRNHKASSQGFAKTKDHGMINHSAKSPKLDLEQRSSKASPSIKSFGYQFEESNTGCCKGT